MHGSPTGSDVDGHLRWNLTRLFEEVLDGLGRLAAGTRRWRAIGIDTWAVDYGLLDADGRAAGEPSPTATTGPMPWSTRSTSGSARERLYAITGLQFLPFNTLYQLAAEQRRPAGAGRARRAAARTCSPTG